MEETKIFKILSSKIRVEILKKLSIKDTCAKELSNLIGKRSPKICDELATLRRYKIVTSYPVGIKTFNHLEDTRFINIIKFTERQ